MKISFVCVLFSFTVVAHADNFHEAVTQVTAGCLAAPVDQKKYDQEIAGGASAESAQIAAGRNVKLNQEAYDFAISRGARPEDAAFVASDQDFAEESEFCRDFRERVRAVILKKMFNR